MISVIIPTYNTDVKYLQECFDSLTNQTYQQFEVLIVDDASTSQTTISFIKDYCLTHPKFKVFYKNKNAGPGSARNFGIKHASGEIITFVDSDDYLLNECLMNVFEAFTNNSDIDFFSFGNYYLENKKLVIKADYAFNTKVVNINSFHNAILEKFSVWGKAYKRSFLVNKKIYFLEENVFLEDLYFFIISLSKAKKFILSSKNLYVLRTTQGSRTQSDVTIKKVNDILRVASAAYFAVKNDDSYISKTYDKLFNLWFYFQVKLTGAHIILKDDPSYQTILLNAKQFLCEIKNEIKYRYNK